MSEAFSGRDVYHSNELGLPPRGGSPTFFNMNIIAIQTRIFTVGEELAPFVVKYIPRPEESDIVVVTSKIVALAEGRVAPLNEWDVRIKKESEWALNTRHAWITITDGMVMANAGIDKSNAENQIVLLPKDSFAAAAALRSVLRRRFKIKKLGVLITDSRTAPLRAGVVAAAVGYAGFSGIKDYHGKKDIHGRKLTITRVNIADSLATASALLMGEGNERRPLAIIRNAPVVFRDKIDRNELHIPLKDDLFEPLFRFARTKRTD